MIRGRPSRSCIALATIVIGLLLHELVHAGGGAAFLAHFGPALLLLAPLLLGRYPGERVLERMSRRGAPRRRRRRVRTGRRPARPQPRRRGALMGEHLATRPPPLGGPAG